MGLLMPRKKILIADNDALLRELLRHALEAEGYEVTLASDGLEAWHMLQRDPPDYLVLDLVMPKLDGARLCHYVKTDPRLASLRVFVLTATSAETAPRLLALGADGYLAKRAAPEMVRELLRALRSAETGGPPEIPPPSAGVAGGHPRQIVSELLAESRHMNAILRRTRRRFGSSPRKLPS